jgi:hypothetical protein
LVKFTLGAVAIFDVIASHPAELDQQLLVQSMRLPKSLDEFPQRFISLSLHPFIRVPKYCKGNSVLQQCDHLLRQLVLAVGGRAQPRHPANHLHASLTDLPRFLLAFPRNRYCSKYVKKKGINRCMKKA